MRALLCLFVYCCLSLSLVAALPMVGGKKWMGYFAVHEAQRYDFLVQVDGEITLVPKQRGKEPVAVANQIRIDYGIEELRPNGKVVCKKTRPNSLSSEQEETDDIRKVVIRGVSTGDAVFELVVEQSRDVMSIGGRVVDCGELTEFPLRFAVRVSIPNVYSRVEIDGKGDQRAFDKKTRGDYVELSRIDGTKVKLSNDDSAAIDGDALSGSGVEEVEMRLSYYEGRRFYFQSSRDSKIVVSGGRVPGPWYEGMVLHWVADAAKDADGKARLSFCVK